MPAKTHTAALPEAAKRFELLNVNGSPFLFDIADVVKLITDENGPSGDLHSMDRA